MPKPQAYWLIGPPACGKSTWREKKAPTLNNAVVISSDDMIEEIAKREGKTYAEVHKEVDLREIDKKLAAKVIRAVLADQDIIFDQTNLTLARRQMFMKYVPASYQKTAVVFEYDKDEVRRRCKERGEKTGKVIPEAVLEKMLHTFHEPSLDIFGCITTVKENGEEISRWRWVVTGSSISAVIGAARVSAPVAPSGFGWAKIKPVPNPKPKKVKKNPKQLDLLVPKEISKGKQVVLEGDLDDPIDDLF